MSDGRPHQSPEVHKRIAIGVCMKRRRKKAKMTLKKVAQLGGPCPAFLSDVENGKRTISVIAMLSFCSAVNCTPVALMNDIVRCINVFSERDSRNSVDN
jgi:transcriptional regulator with XRE-family HTH domain